MLEILKMNRKYFRTEQEIQREKENKIPFVNIS